MKKFLIGTTIVLLGLTSFSTTGFAKTYQKGIVSADSLNVRSENSISSQRVASLSKGDAVTIVDYQDGWSKINIGNNTEGWVKSEYINTNDVYEIGYIYGENVNIRTADSLSSPVLAKCDSGVSVKVIQKNDEWYKIQLLDGTQGYIFQDYIKMKKDAIQVVSRGYSSNYSGMIEYSKKFLGKKYVWGTEGPDTFDCSGFTRFVFKNSVGKNLPHSSKAQSQLGKRVSKSDLETGDLIFFDTDNSGDVNHVGIYIGGGNFIHASSARGNVMISSIDSGFYEDSYLWAVRV